jgi:predicted nucleic acid-binding protein
VALYVPDASFILGWGVDEDAFESRAKVVERMAREGGIVPSLWRLEVANALLMGVRRGRWTMAQGREVLADISKLGIDIDEATSSHAWGRTLLLAERHGLTEYDAAYVELAIRADGILLTLDHEMARAARAEGLEVLV